MTNHHRINYIEFPATDIEKTKLFYNSVFGWNFTDYGPDYTAFTDGALDGGFTTEASAKDSGVLVILYSENLAETLEMVAQTGAQITKPIYEFPGGRRFNFKDPSGNELAVWGEPL